MPGADQVAIERRIAVIGEGAAVVDHVPVVQVLDLAALQLLLDPQFGLGGDCLQGIQRLGGTRLTASATLSGGGRRIFFSNCEVRDAEGRLVATGSGTFKYRT